MPDPRPVVAVLGAMGGIGSACVQALLSRDVAVVAVVRSAPGLDELATRVADPSRITGCAVDLAAASDGATIVAAALEAFGRLDGLVNTAAVYRSTPATALSEWQWESVMGPNLRGALLVASSVGQHLADQGSGRIVQVTSITAKVSRGDYALYEASKAGLTAAARSMAVELAPFGVTVNCVAPGWVRTRMSEDFLADVPARDMARLIPAGRVGEAAEIAAVVTWLLTDSPSFLTGQTIVVDGGQTAFTDHL